MNEERIIDRLCNYMKYKGLNDNQVTKEAGLSSGLIGRAKKGYSDLGKKAAGKILTKYPDLNNVWLFTGSGKMINNPEKEVSDNTEIATNEPYTENAPLVPLLNLDSVGGFHGTSWETNESEYIVAMVPFPGAREGDFLMEESGESMSPTIPPGAKMLLRRVELWYEYFGYGGVFVLALKDGRRITKQVLKGSDREHVTCRSHNPEHPDEELPRSMIMSVFKVVKILVDKGF